MYILKGGTKRSTQKVYRKHIQKGTTKKKEGLKKKGWSAKNTTIHPEGVPDQSKKLIRDKNPTST